MDIEVSFSGGKCVEAQVGRHVVRTDQPHDQGGLDGAPSPFELFLASLATCAGYYALVFCQTRGLSTEGLRLRQHVEVHPETHLPTRMELHVTLPPSFPEKYRQPLVRAIEGCKVKKTLGQAPAVAIVLAPA